MSKLPQVSKAMQRVLSDEARQAGYVTGFVQRQSKLRAEIFVQTLTFGWMADPEASLEKLTQTAALLGVEISPQGLDQRFSEEAASCLKRVLEAAIGEVITASPVAIPILRRFTSVQLFDTTIVTLPDELVELWPGCGGTKGTTSSIKVEVGLELITGKPTGPYLQSGRAGGSNGILQRAKLPAGSLRLTDLGYFNLGLMQELSKQQVYWLTRVKSTTGLVDRDDEKWSLFDFLRAEKSNQIDIEIRLGFDQQLACRLLAVRVPKEVAQERKRRLRDKARRNCSNLKKETLALAEWTVLATNADTKLLSLEDALVLARTRWQIELLFKLWKSHGQIDKSRSEKVWRILCEIYAKLLAMLIQFWVLIVSSWRYPNRSLFKAAQTVQMLALHLAIALSSLKQLSAAISLIERCIAAGCRINKRKKAPSNFQLLLSRALA